MTMEIHERAKAVKLLAMDVDGTLTDGAMYFSSDGVALKRFSTRDGMGITLWHRAGLQTAIITSEDSAIARRRAEKLHIENVILHSHNKTADLQDLLRSLDLTLEQVAYIGDDVNDIPVMRVCGLTACPADSVAAVRTVSMVKCTANGGDGAVREFIELILSEKGLPVTLPENW